MEKSGKCLAVVRVRGPSDVREETEETLKMLRLNRGGHTVLIDDRPSYTGMLKKTQNIVAWGEVSKETVLLLLTKRGKTVGNERLTNDYAKKAGYDSLEDMAEAIWKLEVDYKDLPDIKPVFRLHPPRKGFRGGVKKSFSAGGSLGYMGESINGLLKKMA